jgi:hypothetical protein
MPECVSGVATFDVTVSASNACGETGITPCTIEVACKAEPCIDQVEGSGPEEAEAGEPVELCITARNCSTDPEDITLTIDGESQLFEDVPPGETREFCVTRTMPECEGGQEICFPASATATNDCGEVTVPIEICIECRAGGPACPRTIGFWRQQCAQRLNGSTKVCLEGMYTLWNCVLGATGVIQWKNNDGSFTTTASLGALTDEQLFEFFCSQLDGPRPMTLLDMAEIQYLGLMLNVCSGALPAGTPLDNSFDGTVAAAIDSIENAINTGENLDFWKTVADEINNRIGVLAADCEDGDDLFRNIPPCDEPAAPDAGSLGTGASVGDAFVTRNYPNPVREGSTSIYYTVPGRADRSAVEIAVFDAGGRLVKTLVSGEKAPGAYTADWDLTDDGGSRVSSGIYFYRVLVAGEKITQKLLVIRR